MNEEDDNKKIIEFPSKQERNQREEEIRKQYREEQKAAKKAQKIPLVNWDKIPFFARILLTIIISIHVLISFGLDDLQRIWLFENLGFTPAYYSGVYEWNWNPILAPVTTLFLHGSWMHLLFNIIMLMAMGIFCERQFGAKTTAIIFMLSGMAGNILYFILTPTTTIPVIGASGAISGLFAVSLMFMIENGHMGPEMQRRGPLPFILLWSTIIIALGFISAGTAWQSHLGGFLCGITLVQMQKKGWIRLFW